MLRRSTIFALLLLAALVGLAVYLSNREPAEEEISEDVQVSETVYLFDQSDGQARAIRLESRDGQVVAVRQTEAGAWRFEQPVSVDAELGLVESATSQMMTLSVLNTLDMPLSAVGLDQPAFVITIQFITGKETTIKVGQATPTGSGYYVLRDNGEIVIVGKAGLDSLLRIFHNPPALPTSTPEPEAADSPTATP